MAGKRREEAKRTEAIENAAAKQETILERLAAIESKLDQLIAASAPAKPRATEGKPKSQ